MLLRFVDKLLIRSFQRGQSYKRLEQLETDVWRKIRQSKTAQGAISFMMPVWSNTQLRYVCLSLALISGIAVSMASFQPSVKNDTLGLDVFSPNASFFMTYNYNYKKLDIVSL